MPFVQFPSAGDPKAALDGIKIQSTRPPPDGGNYRGKAKGKESAMKRDTRRGRVRLSPTAPGARRHMNWFLATIFACTLAHAGVNLTFGKLPLRFELARDAGEHAKFIARGNGYTLFLSDGEAILK